MEWLLQTPKPPRVPEFYTLTKIHKPKPVGRPIISGCDGPTERISAFVDRLIQPIAKIQNSYIKDRTDFILHQVHRTQKTSTKHAISYNGCNSSRYTNIPQEQGMQIVCAAYDKFVSTTPRYLDGDEGSRCLCEHLHGGNRNSNLTTKRTQTATMDTLYWRYSISLGNYKRWSTIIHSESIFNQFHPKIKFTAEVSEGR